MRSHLKLQIGMAVRTPPQTPWVPCGVPPPSGIYQVRMPLPGRGGYQVRIPPPGRGGCQVRISLPAGVQRTAPPAGGLQARKFPPHRPLPGIIGANLHTTSPRRRVQIFLHDPRSFPTIQDGSPPPQPLPPDFPLQESQEFLGGFATPRWIFAPPPPGLWNA